MSKILTISIAAYNSELFIEKTLASLTDQRYVDQLEVFVIDDGGTDRTLEIAKQFEEKYPDTFHAIHKENGGYGSTFNYSIAHATGKYFKLLDGDDWLDADGLSTVIEKLSNSDEDVIITGMFSGTSETDCKISLPNEPDDWTCYLTDYHPSKVFGMWVIYYKTSIIRQSGLHLPEKTLYSDQLFSVIPFSHCKTIRFLKIPVYFYRTGQEGQSTSIESRKKHCQEMYRICDQIYDYYEQNKCFPYLLKRVSRYYIVALKTILLFSSEKNGKQLFVDYEKEMQQKHPEIYADAIDMFKFGKLLSFMRQTNYVFFPLLRIIPPNIGTNKKYLKIRT